MDSPMSRKEYEAALKKQQIEHEAALKKLQSAYEVARAASVASNSDAIPEESPLIAPSSPDGTESAKYVQGRVGMACSIRKKVRVLKQIYRQGVMVINLSDKGSLCFYYDANCLTIPENEKVSGLSVYASNECYVESSKEPYLRIPSHVPWEFKAISDSCFQITVPPDNGELDTRVELQKERSTDSSKTKQVFIFQCKQADELAVYAKASHSIHRIVSENVAEKKRTFNIPALISPSANNMRIRSETSVQIAAQNARINRSKSVAHLQVSRGESIGESEFRCYPLYCYPNQWITKSDLAVELPRSSKNVKDLRLNSPDEIGSLKVEVLQCSGLQKLDKYGLTDAYCFIVLGQSTFVTDVIPDNCNPCWLPMSRRACIVPIHNAYSQLYVGVFDYDGEKAMDDFGGRVVIDIPQLQPGRMMDITLPLREYNRVYDRKSLGSIRLRLELKWTRGPRDALLSYLPKKMSGISKRLDSPTTVKCPDAKSFHNVALTVYGADVPGRFSNKLKNAVTWEMKLIKSMMVHNARKTAKDIQRWRSPMLSAYIFCSYMHFVTSGLGLLPAFIVSLVLIFIISNYRRYHVNSPAAKLYGGNITIFDMTWVLLFGGDGEKKVQRPQLKKLISRLDADDGWRNEDHLEFPFSAGKEYPKRTIDEAAAAPIWEAAQDEKKRTDILRMGRSEHEEDHLESDDENYDEFFSTDETDQGAKRKTLKSMKSLIAEIEADAVRIPNQDVSSKRKSANKPIQREIDEWHAKAHKASLNLFDDRVFMADDRADAERKLQINTAKMNPIAKMINPIMVQVLKTFEVQISAFRATFNVFFWKDPYLSYWATIFFSVVMIVFLVFPWRLFFFGIGLVGLGPQNYFLADWYASKKSKKGDKKPLLPDSSKKNASSPGKETQKTPETNLSDSPLLLRNNIQMKPEGVIREVIIPSLPARYNRFYDWPPDPESTTMTYNQKKGRNSNPSISSSLVWQ